MPLVDRYLAKEILLPFGAGLVFLTQLLLATQLLAQADVLFGSGVSLVDLAAVVLAMLPSFVGYVLPIAFLLGAVLGVGRLAEDREIIALGAAGLSPARLARVPLLLGAVVAAFGVWSSLWLEPAGLAGARVRLNEIVKRNVRNDVRPGVFYDQIPGTTLYAEAVKDGRWTSVLISDRTDPAAPVLALAREGRLEPVGMGQEMKLVLEGGELHRETADGDEYVTAAFRRAEVVLGLGTALTDRNWLARSAKELGPAAIQERIRRAVERGDLAEARRFQGYLHRKIAQPLAVLAFALLALPLGASRRSGRALSLGAMVLAVVSQYVLMRGGEVLAQKGVLPAALALQIPTVVLCAAGIALVALQARRGVGAVR